MPCHKVVEQFLFSENDEECIADETELYSYLDATIELSYYAANLYYNNEYFVSDKYGE